MAGLGVDRLVGLSSCRLFAEKSSGAMGVVTVACLSAKRPKQGALQVQGARVVEVK